MYKWFIVWKNAHKNINFFLSEIIILKKIKILYYILCTIMYLELFAFSLRNK